MKRYTAGSLDDVSKILRTGRHMKQYALAKRKSNTQHCVVLCTEIRRLTEDTLKK